MHRRVDTIIYIVSAVFLIGALSLWWQGVRPAGREVLRDSGPIGEPPPPSDPNGSVENVSDPAVLVVHVGGAVKSPGVYRLKEGQRVYEAVMLAQPEDEADLDALNLAAVLKDSQKIVVPKKREPSAVGSGWSSGWSGTGTGFDSGSALGSAQPPSPSFPLNVNTASASELEALPGIGPSLAGEIVNYRDKFGSFAKLEDLKNVSGIGDKIFVKISSLLTVD